MYDFTGIIEWQLIDGWFDLYKAIAVQRSVKQLPANSQLVELGSWCGRSSVAIAAVLPENAVLYCVDHFQGSREHKGQSIANLENRFRQNIEAFGVNDRIKVLRETTTAAAQRFADNSVDLILVDASHDYASVKSDLDHWIPKLKPNGYLFCDDANMAGVSRAITACNLKGDFVADTLWMSRNEYW